jgi:hypothetical protein
MSLGQIFCEDLSWIVTGLGEDHIAGFAIRCVSVTGSSYLVCYLVSYLVH